MAYEMRISDWSSYVCSSDLHHPHVFLAVHPGEERRGAFPLTRVEPLGGVLDGLAQLVADMLGDGRALVAQLLFRLKELLLGRSVRRRVGQEWVSTVCSRGSQEH